MEDRALWLFEQVHGSPTGQCYCEAITDENGVVTGVGLFKDGHLCWERSLVELLVEYATLGKV